MITPAGRLLLAAALIAVGCSGPVSTTSPPASNGPPAAPADPVAVCASSTTGVSQPTPNGPPGAETPPFPPPLVSPEAVEDLQRIAGLAEDLASPVRAPVDGAGVIYLGTESVETVGGYMDRVVDNLDSFWRSVFETADAACAFVKPERAWLIGSTRSLGSCGKLVDELTGAYYCTTGSSTDRDGSITVGQRWMFDKIYARFGDRAAFAVASVLAHEMGHHVQDLLGIVRDTAPHRCCGLTSLNTELHADCLGGTWAYSLYGRSEIDLASMEQAVRAAQAAGDAPETNPSDTGAHGTPEQRRQWFENGFEAGRVGACDGALTLQQ